MKDKLKIGLLIDDYNLPAWNIKMLKNIINYHGSEIVLIVKKDKKKNIKNRFVRYIYSDFNYFLYRLYSKIDKIIFRASPDAFKSKDISTVLPLDKIEILKIVPLQKETGDYINKKDVEQIKKYKIDILIKLGFKNLMGEIYDAASYGIWAYFIDDKILYEDSPPGFWEVMDYKYDTNINIVILNNNRKDYKLLLNSRFQTIHLSVYRNLNKIYWKSTSFLPSQIRELYEKGADEFFRRIDRLNNFFKYNSTTSKGYPKNSRMFFKGFLMILSYTRIKLRNIFFIDQWILLFSFDNASTNPNVFSSFKKILPPKDRFYADPFILRKKDKYFIYFEELIFAENKGFISVIEIDRNGNYKKPVKVLERDYHLSYPYLFEYNGDLYMIPETGTNNDTIELYSCLEFPFKWQFEKVLIENIKAFDSTIIFKDGKYWLFTYLECYQGRSLTQGLYLFSADEPISTNWKYHAQNPIVPDAILSRPAGHFFTQNDHLYRPSQDCSKHYGYGMKIYQVLELSESNYEEKEIDSIYPDWDKNVISTHTINSVENITVIDAQFRRRRF